MLTMKNDCIGYGLGGTWRLGDLISAETGENEEDEWRVYFQIWLQAFPFSPLRIGG